MYEGVFVYACVCVIVCVCVSVCVCDQLRDGAVLKRQSLNELVSVGVKLCFEHVCACELERVFDEFE